MMEPVMRVQKDTDRPLDGNVRYDFVKMTWNLGFILAAIVFAPTTFSWSAFFVFLILTYFSLLIGHSVGMHRMMIHRTFKANKYVSRLLIYIGVLVGMSGPFSIIRIHDLRDWAQRKSQCHDFFSHKANFFQDLWWQLTSRFEFTKPPVIDIEPSLKNDKVLRFFESTWRWHQLMLALVLYYLGGWSFVVWGVFARVAVSIVGHWSITYFCHNPGPGTWRVKDVAVQASNLKGLGLITYGECWHNNHHAFPESAKIGIEKGQWDPSWWFISFLKRLGVVYDVKLPRPKNQRGDLEQIG